MDGNDCVTGEKEPDIYAHICDLGLWLLTKDETLIVMLMAQMA